MRVYNPKVLHQGIDFLVIDYFSLNVDIYNKRFIPFLDKLDRLKKEAQSEESFGVKFVKSELVKGYGDWFVSSKGLNRFAFYIENSDYRVFISRAKINSDLPQIRVEIPAKTIFRIGVHKAIDLFERFLRKLIGKRYIRKVNRLDLATDVGGIMYVANDIFRFQTRMGVSYFGEDLAVMNYMRFHRFQGIQFGKGDKLFRIYDKTQKIIKSPNEAYIVEKWKFNGYDARYPVYRHEIQYRREEIKRFIPCNCDDEVNYLLSNLGSLWFRALSLVEYVPLNNKELSKIIDNPLIKSDTKRKIFYRAKKDTNRFQFWDILRTWDNEVYEPIEKFKKVKTYSIENVKKLFKGFFGSLFKYSGGDLTKFKEVVDEVERDLRKMGVDLISYGLNKLATSFIENYGVIIMCDEVVDKSEYIKVVDLYDVFMEAIDSVNNKDYQRVFKKVVNLV